MNNNIVYRLIAYVDDSAVYESDYADTTELQYDLNKAEELVERYIEKDKELMEDYDNDTY